MTEAGFNLFDVLLLIKTTIKNSGKRKTKETKSIQYLPLPKTDGASFSANQRALNL